MSTPTFTKRTIIARIKKVTGCSRVKAVAAAESIDIFIHKPELQPPLWTMPCPCCNNQRQHADRCSLVQFVLENIP